MESMVPPRPFTFRVENIPPGTTDDELIKYFCTEDQPRIRVRSMVPAVDSYEDVRDLTATVTFQALNRSVLSPRLLDEDISIDCDFHGFTPLYHPQEPIAADIIAVAGLAAHAFGSWAHSAQNMWLRDYLPKDVSDARVLIYGYPSQLHGNISRSILSDHSTNMIHRLLEMRESANCQDRPIVFIGRSLGCLIIKKMLNGTWKREGAPIMMVSLDSARQWHPREEFVACNADHSQMAKLKRGENSIYPRVRWAIKKALLSAGDLYTEEPKEEANPDPRKIDHGVDGTPGLQTGDLKVSTNGTKSITMDRVMESAIVGGDEAKTRELLAYRYDVNCKGNDGLTPLHLAAIHGQENILRILLEQGANPSARCDQGGTTLHLLASVPGTPITETLIDLVLRDRPPLEIANGGGLTPLMHACLKGEMLLAMRLIRHGADVRATNREGETALHLAAHHGKAPMIHLLVNNGAELEAKAINGFTPLHSAVSGPSDPSDTVEQLLRAGPDKEATFNWRIDIEPRLTKPLHLAILKHNKACITCLLESGANIEASDGVVQHRPLHWAASVGYLEIVKVLLDHGAKIEASDANQRRPLHLAANTSHFEIVKALLDHGANIEASDREGDRPLHYAASVGYLEIVKVLLDHGVNIEASDRDGYRPLHLAAMRDLEIVKALLDHGANPTVKTIDSLHSKPSDLISRRLLPTQKQAIRALLKEAEKTWKQSGEKRKHGLWPIATLR